METWMITGVTGFLGPRVEVTLREKGEVEVLPMTREELNFTDEEQVKRVLGTLHPDVLVHAAAVSDTGQWWLLSADGKLLEQVDAATAQQYAVLSGVSLVSPVSGCAAQMQEEEQSAAAATILAAMEQWGLTEVITTVDLTKLYDIELWYGERFEIKLGSTEDLAYKIQYLQAVLENLNDSQSGVIDLTFETETVARFLPW